MNPTKLPWELARYTFYRMLLHKSLFQIFVNIKDSLLARDISQIVVQDEIACVSRSTSFTTLICKNTKNSFKITKIFGKTMLIKWSS